MQYEIIQTKYYLLVVSDESPKAKDWALSVSQKNVKLSIVYQCKFDGKIDKKIIAHLPLNEAPYLEGVAVLPEMEDEVDFDKIVNDADTTHLNRFTSDAHEFMFTEGVKIGYNKAKETYKYTKEDMFDLYAHIVKNGIVSGEEVNKIIQSLNQPKLPAAFECVMKCGRCGSTDDECWSAKECTRGYDFKDRPKTITNSEGRTEWVGTYKF